MGARLAIYDDSAVFGGHEVMALLGLEVLLEVGVKVLFFYARPNTKLLEALTKLQERFSDLALFEYPTESRKLQSLRNHWERNKINALATEFKNWGADAVLCIQGDLEISSRGLLAGKAAGIPAVSYIPFAHSLGDMGAKYGRFRDLFISYLLNVPDAFITISQEAKAHFQRRGTRVPIDVVYNGIDAERFGASREMARQRFDLPADKPVIALCGRLESKQKGQNFLLHALTRSVFLRDQVLTLFVGDGPDEASLKAEVERLDLNNAVRFTGWCDTASLYAGIDALVIASRFEGMPLVMLEALVSNVPVISTDRDAMKEILPVEWRFPGGDVVALVARLEAVIKNRPVAEIARLSQLVREKMSVESFKSGFTRAVIERCQLPS
jgi:glycosyltransferase involved in cell wall biosynthesis